MELAASSDDKSDNVKTYIEAENDKLSQLLSLKEKTIETMKEDMQSLQLTASMQERLLEVRSRHFCQVVIRLKPPPLSSLLTANDLFNVLDSKVMGLAKQLVINVPDETEENS